MSNTFEAARGGRGSNNVKGEGSADSGSDEGARGCGSKDFNGSSRNSQTTASCPTPILASFLAAAVQELRHMSFLVQEILSSCDFI